MHDRLPRPPQDSALDRALRSACSACAAVTRACRKHTRGRLPVLLCRAAWTCPANASTGSLRSARPLRSWLSSAACLSSCTLPGMVNREQQLCGGQLSSRSICRSHLVWLVLAGVPINAQLAQADLGQLHRGRQLLDRQEAHALHLLDAGVQDGVATLHRMRGPLSLPRAGPS